jgi:4-hydroxy-tetrahydrodipicolinate reductase
VRVALHGATGRMGLILARLAHEAGDTIVGGTCAKNDPGEGRDIGELAGLGTIGVVASVHTGAALLGADVVIDFSTAPAVPELLALAARQKTAVVSGTTNLDAAGKQALTRAAEAVPVLWSANMSLGVQVLAELVASALRRLGPGYDAEIVEIHHKKKIDAPSGTAKRLAESVRSVRPTAREVHGRDGDVGARKDDEVAVYGVRGGDVVGDHTVYLLGPGERLELTHRASSRELFAHGALRAARWVVDRPPGLYTIADVLG